MPAAVGMHCVACVREQSKVPSTVARELTVHQRRARRPGWVFWALIAAFIAGCVLLGRTGFDTLGEVPTDMRMLSFAVVVIGWVISLTLHEWAHAFTAYRSGDHSVVGRGYLRLDPRRYTDLLMSVVLPITFLLIGGIPLPGGAVWIDYGNIRSRHRQALVSAAGPAMNVLFGVLCLAVVKAGVVDFSVALNSTLVYLAWLEFLTAALNLLPIPGLDGYGIIRPYLPYHVQAALMPIAGYAIMVLFVVMISTNAFTFLFDIANAGVEAMGVDSIVADLGRGIGDVRLLTG